MNRTEMIDELLERLEAELDELNNGQLSSILSEYEHMPLLANVVESLSDDDEDDSEEDSDDDEDAEDIDDLPIVDENDWDEELDEE